MNSGGPLRRLIAITLRRDDSGLNQVKAVVAGNVDGPKGHSGVQVVELSGLTGHNQKAEITIF